MIVSPASLSSDFNGAKRKASTAFNELAQSRSVKRRASKACQCCRARKVRCNVVEHGAPCTNCRLDDIECVVTESRRKRKTLPLPQTLEEDQTLASLSRRLNSEKAHGTSLREGHNANSIDYHSDASQQEEHIPHSLYRHHAQRLSSVGTPPPRMVNGLSFASLPAVFGHNVAFEDNRLAEVSRLVAEPAPVRHIPLWAKDFAPRVGQDDIAFLEKKKALEIPNISLRNELLRCFVEFVYPYMPLFDLGDFLQAIEAGDGSKGKISLVVFQAVMFAGVAMVDIVHLRRAGYASRREARKGFYQRARLLYDFDIDADRITLMQALLLLTFWYERPDDEKDTWHWIGVATSLAYTIGLNRNPSKSNASPKTQKLWKRIWWSCVIRDRVISMGVRRPTRIKAEECDVPMLTLEDFDSTPLPQDVSCIPSSCTAARDSWILRTMALMCIEQAKLCLLISRVFTAQYSIPAQDSRGDTIVESGTATTLVPKQLDPASSQVMACHAELQEWIRQLPSELERKTILAKPITRATAPIVVNGSMLHLIYLTTLHALHRPQTGPGMPASTNPSQDKIINLSRENVTIATVEATAIVRTLLRADCIRFLPTYGVTVLMPASVTNLIDIKSPSPDARLVALEAFYQCAQALNRLRDSYASADHSMYMLEKAVRKAGIEVPTLRDQTLDFINETATPSAKPSTYTISSIDQLLDFCVRQGIVAPAPTNNNTVPGTSTSEHQHANLPVGPTPPPDDLHDLHSISLTQALQHDTDVARRLSAYLATTPPDSWKQGIDHDSNNSDKEGEEEEGTNDNQADLMMFGYHHHHEPYAHVHTHPHAPPHDEATIDQDFESLINAESLDGMFGNNDQNALFDPTYLATGGVADGIAMGLGSIYSNGGGLQFQGESSGFAFDMDWLNSPVLQSSAFQTPRHVEDHDQAMQDGEEDEGEESMSGTTGSEEMEEAEDEAHIDGAGRLIEEAAAGDGV